MSFKKLLAFIVVIIIAKPCLVRAQDAMQEEKQFGVCISVAPHLVFTRTLKTELDLQIANSNSWIVGSFLITRRFEDLLWDFKFDMMETYGGSLSYRYYFEGSEERHHPYVQAGFVYNQTSVNNENYTWESVNYNGTEALINVKGVLTEKMIQYGGDLKFGCMIKCNQFIFFDLYIGLGLRDSKELYTEVSKNYKSSFLGPAHYGTVPLIGFRFGISL